MFLRTYQQVEAYLAKTQETLEQNEVANCLMLGICLRLKQFPERVKIPPYFATVEDEHGLIVAACMTPPSNVVKGTVSASTGLEPRRGEATVTDWFLKGTQPTIIGSGSTYQEKDDKNTDENGTTTDNGNNGNNCNKKRNKCNP